MAKSSSDCGCPNGKTYLIDPNQIMGQDIGDNLFIPPEDLNIYVELTTSKKSRSIIDVGDEGVVGVSSEQGKSRVSFIDGSNVGYDKDGKEKKSLTTKYTDLTTVFNKTEDTENLGIKSIDIDFNSSYAPVVKIEFVDIRGSSLFNSGNPPKSQYATFFDLPYPIFELTVKGYYGKAVKYCLHLTKWNARFNAESGNFEISADFIGYTYAMLTDMLLGYLRAITKTPCGKIKFAEAKAEMKDPEKLITINQLLDRIKNVNEDVIKVNEDNENVKILAANKNLLNILKNVKNLTSSVIKTLSKSTNSTENAIFFKDNLLAVKHDESTNSSQQITNYKSQVKTYIEEVNLLLGDNNKLKLEDFQDVRVSTEFIYNSIFIDPLKTPPVAGSLSKKIKFRADLQLIGNQEEFDSFQQKVESLKKTAPVSNLDFYDFSTIVTNIDDFLKKIESSNEDLKENIADDLREEVVKNLKFEPTIRNIFRIFTIHSEIFINCLKETSVKAETDKSGLRMAELQKLKDDFDIHKKDSTNEGSLPSKIFAWPLYRKKSKLESKKEAYEESWIGERLDNPLNVPEVVFVEDLLKGLLKVNREDEERLSSIENSGIVSDSWYPVSPLDTPLFGVTKNPYKTKSIGDSVSPSEPLKLMMYRAFTFLGLSNRRVFDIELSTMATLEAHTANIGILDDNIKKLMVGSGTDDEQAKRIISGFKKGEINGTPIGGKNKLSTQGKSFMKNVSLIGENNTTIDYYQYQYISPSSQGNKTYKQSFIPFNGDFTGDEFYNSSKQFQGYNGLSMNPKSINVDLDTSLPDTLDNDPKPLVYTSSVTPEHTGTSVGVDISSTFCKIVPENYYGVESLQPNYEGQNEIIQKMLDEVKSGEEDFLEVGSLHEANPRDTKQKYIELKGFNIFGHPSTSKFAFTTIARLNYNSSTIDNQKAIYPTGKADGFAKAIFYINRIGEGTTNLSNRKFVEAFGKTPNTYELDPTQTYSKGGVEYAPVRLVSLAPGYTRHPNGGIESFTNTRNFIPTDHIPFHGESGQNRELFLKTIGSPDELMVNRIDFSVDNHFFSLFGSQLYFEQRQSSSPKAARALLFLYTFPWNNIFNENANLNDDGYGGGLFDNEEANIINNLFSKKAAFVNTPKIWAAWLGGIIWRADNSDIIYDDDNGGDVSDKVPTYAGGSGTFDPIIFGKPTTPTNPTSDFSEIYVSSNINEMTSRLDWPTKQMYLTSRDADVSLQFTSSRISLVQSNQYKMVDKVIQNLPKQIKNEFKKAFFDFVNGSQWEGIREELEVHPKVWDNNIGVISSPPLRYAPNGFNNGNWDGGTFLWKQKWNEVGTSATTNPNVTRYENATNTSPDHFIRGISRSWLTTNIRNLKNFEVFQPITFINSNTNDEIKYDYDIAYKGGTAVNGILVKLFSEGVWIANASYKAWLDDRDPSFPQKDKILARQDDLLSYVTSFVKEFRDINKIDEITKKENAEKEAVFNTMDDNTIRLNIYRHCKAVYDKWIAGSSGNVIAACGGKSKTPEKDLATAQLDRNSNKPRLIDSFRFVNRAFNDLGDDFLINPGILTDVITNNPNQSFYNLISRVLADNNFNFIALPAFIDYEKPDAICDVFKPEIFNERLDEATAGPTFICVYAGQVSNKLDLGNESDFPNDGFDFKCGENGTLSAAGDNTLPKDFTGTKKPHEHNVVAFAVNYGHQNQNIFTDIKLDQQEFSETDESLTITNSIANNGAQSKRTLAGQNLWNIYQVRAYNSEVTAMGNAMIQPMMYYQLNNIPMFHGAYHVIHVKHKITPNHMTTTFKGVRTRYVDTPIIDSETLYMSMLGSLSDVDSAGPVGKARVAGDFKYYGNDEKNGIEYNNIVIKRPKN